MQFHEHRWHSIAVSYLTLLLFCGVSFSAHAQKSAITLTGKVINTKGLPVAGASVTEKNGTAGAIVNEGGSFSLRVSAKNATLLVSATGYATAEISTDNKLDIEIRLVTED